jgi:antitoxin (DNA-binding transcriptional repressor) of toxin-antitoxin stability system
MSAPAIFSPSRSSLKSFEIAPELPFDGRLPAGESADLPILHSNGYGAGVGAYTVAEANENFAQFINRALNGEGVATAPGGAPVAALRAVRPGSRPITEADLASLDARQVTPQAPLAEGAASLVSRRGDEVNE